MSDIIDFQAAKRKQLKTAKQKTHQAARKKTLCQNGHHKWQVDKKQQFDVKQGKLVTVYRCAHCQKTKKELH